MKILSNCSDFIYFMSRLHFLVFISFHSKSNLNDSIVGIKVFAMLKWGCQSSLNIVNGIKDDSSLTFNFIF